MKLNTKLLKEKLKNLYINKDDQDNLILVDLSVIEESVDYGSFYYLLITSASDSSSILNSHVLFIDDFEMTKTIKKLYETKKELLLEIFHTLYTELIEEYKVLNNEK
jgi:hypothetical protein